MGKSTMLHHDTDFIHLEYNTKILNTFCMQHCCLPFCNLLHNASFHSVISLLQSLRLMPKPKTLKVPGK